ncbi:MAG: hypothetical protein ACE5IJ_11805 [Thermoplasmata archaeon]
MADSLFVESVTCDDSNAVRILGDNTIRAHAFRALKIRINSCPRISDFQLAKDRLQLLLLVLRYVATVTDLSHSLASV